LKETFSMKLLDVPLFPLELVLFPQMVLPLRIFESRYHLMINECLKNNAPFGVVLLQEGDSVQEGRLHPEAPKPFTVGTLARITEVARLEEGALLITTVGSERFRLLEYRNEKPYMTGDIEIWPDQPEELEPGVLQQTVSRVRLVFEQYLRILMELAGKPVQNLELPAEAEALSFLVPNWLYISTQGKQKLLEAPGLSSRLEKELQLLETETNFFEKIKSKANQPDTFEVDPNPPEETENMTWREAYLYNLRDRFSSN
jgi:Lon protease-like protein